MAVLSDVAAKRVAVFEAGFRDYIAYPFIAAEIDVRLGGTSALRIAGKIIDSAGGHKFSKLNKPTEHESKLVTTTCAFLLKDISVHHDLDYLARLIGTNRNSLARAFKHVIGKGVYAWLREQRMIAATEFLTATDLSIQEISFNVGYEDPGNFSTSFKHLYGVSPRTYRQLMRESKI